MVDEALKLMPHCISPDASGGTPTGSTARLGIQFHELPLLSDQATTTQTRPIPAVLSLGIIAQKAYLP